MPTRHATALPSCGPWSPPPPATVASTSDDRIDVAFYDTRKNANVNGMIRAAALVNSSRVRFHALLSYPRPVPGMRVAPLAVQGPAACLYRNLCRQAHGPGRQYLYKPLDRAGTTAAVLLMNGGATARNLTLNLSDVPGLRGPCRSVRSLWDRRDLGGAAGSVTVREP